MKKILIIIGSFRQGSFNKTAAKYIQEQFINQNFNSKILNYDNVPFFNQDIEFPPPQSVSLVRQEIKNSDLVWIVTPEYNGSIPGILKNLLDWISRPIISGEYGIPDIIKNKKVAITSISGSSAGKTVIKNMYELLQKMKMIPLDKTLGLSIPSETFKTGKFQIDFAQRKLLDEQIKSALHFL